MTVNRQPMELATAAATLRAVSSTVGYLSPSGMYLSLTQSNADEDKLVGSIGADLYPTGVEDVDGVTWVVYSGGDRDGRDGEPLWTTRLDGPTSPAQIAITGAGTPDEFRTLAAATQTASPTEAPALAGGPLAASSSA